MKKKNRIALYGIGGLYNYGCEAIVRGCVALLREFDSEAIINYYTPLREDSNVISDLKINTILIKNTQKLIFRRGINKIFRKINIPYAMKFPINKKVIEDNDIIISIGGDMYTIAKYLRNRDKYVYKNSLVDFGNVALEKGKKIIIIGASIGPFGDYRKAVDYYSEHLKRCELILCREKNSISYLKSINVDRNVTLFPDPAFFVINSAPKAVDSYKDAKYIGLNLSPLSFYETYGGITTEVINILKTLIEEIIEKTETPIMLIPHVFNVKENDNDLLFLTTIKDSLSAHVKQRVKIVEPDGFIDVKQYLRKCKMVIAARMHCGVNAVCEGIPTIFLAYSSKAIGMAEFVYDSSDFVLKLEDIEQDILINLTQKMLCEKNSIHEYLVQRVMSIREEYKNEYAYQKLKEMVSIYEDS